MVDLLVLGLGVAGFAAAKKARETDFNQTIAAIDPWAYDSYSPCGLPFLLDGTIKRMDAVYHRLPLTDMDIQRIVGSVTGLDPKGRVVTYKDRDGGQGTIEYKKLVIATGARAAVPAIAGMPSPPDRNVFTFGTPMDAEAVLKALENGAEKALVVGGGPKGCELAVILRRRGLEVVLCEAGPHLLPGVLDADMAPEVQGNLEMMGIDVRTGVEVTEVMMGDEGVRGVAVADGDDIPCDLFIIAAGVVPNIEAFLGSGISTDPEHGIIVGEDMRTSLGDVYACGDVALCRSAIDHNPIPAKLATTAIHQGVVAGANAAGGELKYPGTVSSTAVVLGDQEVASVGLNAGRAKQRGLEVKQVKTKGKNRPEYFPGWSDMTLKMIFDKDSKRLVGAQAVGGEGAIARIDHLGVALAFKAGVDDLYRMELSYTPPRSEGTDIIIKTATYAKKKLR